MIDFNIFDVQPNQIFQSRRLLGINPDDQLVTLAAVYHIGGGELWAVVNAERHDEVVITGSVKGVVETSYTLLSKFDTNHFKKASFEAILAPIPDICIALDFNPEAIKAVKNLKTIFDGELCIISGRDAITSLPMGEICSGRFQPFKTFAIGNSVYVLEDFEDVKALKKWCGENKMDMTHFPSINVMI